MPEGHMPTILTYFRLQKDVAALMLALAAGDGLVAAAELKVDLSATGRRDTGAPHFTEWQFNPAHPATNFGGITVTLRQVGETGSGLDTGLYKFGLDYDARLACDGVFVKHGEAGGQMEMVIGGLTPGPHTIVTYHNSLVPKEKAFGTFDLYANGKSALTGIQPTVQGTNDYEVTSVCVPVMAEAGKDVVLKFVGTGSSGTSNVVLNGFEIDSSDPALKAIKPFPANDDEHVNGDDGTARLAWTQPASAKSAEVYFGTNAEAVAKADRSSALWKGAQEGSSYLAKNLSAGTDYFWRVDEVDAAKKVTRGEIWRFQIRHLAFASAEGYGRFARGGRGGRVIEVTNLEDYDPGKNEAIIPGSFRAAVEADGPRTIVFRVSGLIKLKRSCAVHNPYCTIAGQTAPGDGICLANYSSGAFGTHDVIIRFMRFRIGDEARRAMDGAGMGSCNNCIIDHCSISWSSDEGTSSRGAKNITFQRNIVAEALHHSYHYRAADRTKYETHAFAGSISGDIGSFHHNLLADCTDRNWSLAGGYTQGGMYAGRLDIRNNVVFNWTARTTDGGVMDCDYVNNYYKPLPGNPFVKWLLKLDDIGIVHGTPKYFMAGNVMEGFDYTDNWKAFKGEAVEQKLVRVDQPLFESYVTTQSATGAFTNVLADVGATFPKQDVIDRRLVEEVRTGTTHYEGTRGPTFDPPGKNWPGLIDAPTDVKDAKDSKDFPWPEYRTYNVPTDSDHDGIPDDWEKKFGLDANNPGDAKADRDGDGYSNLEKYLAWLVGEYPAKGVVKTAAATGGQ
jgi:hypothetical protein